MFCLASHKHNTHICITSNYNLNTGIKALKEETQRKISVLLVAIKLEGGGGLGPNVPAIKRRTFFFAASLRDAAGREIFFLSGFKG